MVEPPVLIHFVPARHPPRAAAEGAAGTVGLVLTVDAEGRVTHAEVVDRLGHGLDEAARAAALGFVFQPATRDGAPVAARVRYQYRFELPVRAPSTQPADPLRITEIVVRGKRRGTAAEPFVASSVAPVASVSGEAAKNAGAKNAGEALLEVPGLMVGGPHNQGDRFSDVRIRGFDPGYTLVLVDGERIGSTDDDGKFDLSSMGIDQLERVEVVKGPQALSYGSDAIGGVVNLVTRSPGDRRRLFGTAGFGALGTLRTGASASGPVGPSTRLRLFARHERSEGFTDAHDLDRDLRQTTARDDRRPTRKAEVQAEVWQELGRSARLRGSARHYRSRALVERTSNRYIEQGHETGEDARGDLAGTLRLDVDGPAAGAGIVSARVYRTHLDRTRGRDLMRQSGGRFLYRELAGEVQEIRDTIYTLRLGWRQPIGAHNTVSGYAEGRHRRRASMNDGRQQRFDASGILTADARTVRPERLYDKDEQYGVIGLEDEIAFASHAVVVGVRSEDTSTWAGVVTPAASLRLGLAERLDLRLSFGLGYRVPGFELRTQSPVPELDLLGTKYTAGNPDLRPERSRAGQLVLSHHALEDVAWALGLHASQLRDRIEKAIEDDFMGTGLPLERPVNIGRAWTAGLELDLRYQPRFYLGFRGSYAYLATRNLDTGARLNETPTHTASLVATGRVRPWRLDLAAAYYFIGARPRIDAASGVERLDSPVAALHLARLRIGRPLAGGLRLDIDIDNALNARWDRDNDGDSDMPPIRVFGSVSYLFEQGAGRP